MSSADDVFRELQAQLLRIPTNISREFRAAAQDIRKELQANTVRAGAVASQGFVLGWKAIPNGATIEVTNTSDHARWSEYGRRPGKLPPVRAIEEWARSKGLAVSPWAVAQSIAEHGTKGAHVLDASEAYMLRRVEEAIARSLFDNKGSTK